MVGAPEALWQLRVSLVAPALRLFGLALVLFLVVALLFSNYSLTPSSAKLDLAVLIAILVGALVMTGRLLVIEIRDRQPRPRKAH
jgi:hypothetical protein